MATQLGNHRLLVNAVMVATLALLVIAVAVRGMDTHEGRPELAPEDDPDVVVEFPQPMQLLAPAGNLRVQGLTPLLDEKARGSWEKATWNVFQLRGCPKLLNWIESERGQEFERTVGDLRRGGPPEALAALTLIVQLARHTEWSAGFLGRTQHAERLGELLQEWLRVWAEPSVNDVLLREPAMAAALLYGRAMRAAYDAPPIGRNEAPYERARAFVRTLLGTLGAQQTEFGKSFKRVHPRAFDGSLEAGDFLEGCEEEAQSVLPSLDGDCEG